MSRRNGAEINRTAITLCVSLATLMQALDTTIANVSLPHMQGTFAAGPDQIGWVLTSYITAAAIMRAAKRSRIHRISGLRCH